MSSNVHPVFENILKSFSPVRRQWVSISDGLPNDGVVVETKIDDENGIRNEQDLKRSGNLWFHPDGGMYVYYQPTHWRLK